MYTDQYVVSSLELHLFFGRIMKEHALFLKASFTAADPEFSSEAECYKRGFEKVLCQAVTLSDGIVSREVWQSGEVVTEFTLDAENLTEGFTCIAIDQEITRREMKMAEREMCSGQAIAPELCCRVCQLNRTALELLDGLIDFKERILGRTLSCKMFTMNYPLLIEHILREARLYRQYLEVLERDGCISDEFMRETECFWNRIMMEHALFIRGLLDPTEGELIQGANEFAREYGQLLQTCGDVQARVMEDASLCGNASLREESLEETLRFRDFKMAGAEGILRCKIRSLILPLLADHVLREANHYIRLLK